MLIASMLFAPGRRARLGWARRVAAGTGIACTALLLAACHAQGAPSVVLTGAPNPGVASSTPCPRTGARASASARLRCAGLAGTP